MTRETRRQRREREPRRQDRRKADLWLWWFETKASFWNDAPAAIEWVFGIILSILLMAALAAVAIGAYLAVKALAGVV